MTQAVEVLANQIEQLTLSERMSLLEKVLRDIRADRALRDEIGDWDALSDSALGDFEESL